MLDPESPRAHGVQRAEVLPARTRLPRPGEVHRLRKLKQVPVPNVLGQLVPMESPGYVEFTMKGQSYRLEPVYETSRHEDLFFIFKDLTSRTDTYEAGRFLHAPLPRDGVVDLDFNRAYNPPCAFTEFATCPLPAQGEPARRRHPRRRAASPRGIDKALMQSFQYHPHRPFAGPRVGLHDRLCQGTQVAEPRPRGEGPHRRSAEAGHRTAVYVRRPRQGLDGTMRGVGVRDRPTVRSPQHRGQCDRNVVRPRTGRGGTMVTFTCDLRPHGLMWLLLPIMIRGNRARRPTAAETQAGSRTRSGLVSAR